MASPYLEYAAQIEEELYKLKDEMRGVKAQRDELKRQLTKALEELKKQKNEN